MNRSNVRARRRLSAVPVAVAMLVVSGCGTQPGGDMTPQESRDAFFKVVQSTAALLSPDGWAEVSPPSWASCDLGSSEGVKTTWSYAREPLTDHAANAETVSNYWASMGMDVRTVSEPTVSIYATGGDVYGLAFHTEPGLYVIEGSSQCVPGDARELTRQEQEER